MQKLEEIRDKLKAIDAQIAELVKEKYEISKQILSVNDTKTVSDFICKEFKDTEIKKVVYQGVEGAYSHIVSKRIFGDALLENVVTFEDAVNAAADGSASYCVVPIENSSAGIVADIYDLLLKKNVVIVAEYDLHISHCLLGVKGAALSDIKTVYSHPQALMQCAKYLKEHPQWNQISLLNTAVSAKKVKNDGIKEAAAIASELSAGIYGLKILEHGINKNAQNTTRFVVLSREKIFSKYSNKLSLILELPHKKGMLYNTLGDFVFNGLNLVKIESRPIPERTFEYRFFIDIEGNLSSANVSNVLDILAKKVTFLKVLGNYCSFKDEVKDD